MADAAIFDVDGTLVDSVEAHAQAWADVFREFGHEVPAGAIRTQIGKGGDQLMPVFLDRETLERDGEAIEKRRGAILRERYLAGIQPFPCVRPLFERLLAAGVRVALASSAKRDELRVYKDKAEIADLVGAETSSEDADRSKPHPDIFEAALARLGPVDRARVVVIGDSPYDAEAAGKAGLAAIGLLSGGFPEAELRRAGARDIYRDPAELLARLDGSLLMR